MSLIVDGLQLQDRAGHVYFDLVRGRQHIPAARVAISSIPFRHGQRGEQSMADRRALEIESRELAIPGAIAHQAFLDELKARMSPLREAPIMVRDLLPSGLERWCYAWPRACDVERAGGSDANPISVASLALEALDPFWYSAYGTLDLDDGVEMDDDELMDAGGEIVVIPPTTEVTFTNPGNADVERIRVRFIGASSGGVGIENLSTPELVGFTSTEVLAAGDRITVNNYHRTALRDTGTATAATTVRGAMALLAGNQHGEYLRLVPGSNTLRILGAPAEARVTFFPTWL